MQEYTRTFFKVILNPPRKSIFSFWYKKPQIDSLKALSSRVTPIKHNKFHATYGNIMDLVTEKVDFGALTTLAQHYDISLWCFTFPDFQIAHILEEFGRILDQPITDHNPFPKLEEDIIMSNLALVLGLDVNEAVANCEGKLWSKIQRKLKFFL